MKKAGLDLVDKFCILNGDIYDRLYWLFTSGALFGGL